MSVLLPFRWDRRYKYPEKFYHRVLELYEDGIIISDIAEKFKVSKSTIWGICKKNEKLARQKRWRRESGYYQKQKGVLKNKLASKEARKRYLRLIPKRFRKYMNKKHLEWEKKNPDYAHNWLQKHPNYHLELAKKKAKIRPKISK